MGKTDFKINKLDKCQEFYKNLGAYQKTAIDIAIVSIFLAVVVGITVIALWQGHGLHAFSVAMNHHAFSSVTWGMITGTAGGVGLLAALAAIVYKNRKQPASIYKPIEGSTVEGSTDGSLTSFNVQDVIKRGFKQKIEALKKQYPDAKNESLQTYALYELFFVDYKEKEKELYEKIKQLNFSTGTYNNFVARFNQINTILFLNCNSMYIQSDSINELGKPKKMGTVIAINDSKDKIKLWKAKLKIELDIEKDSTGATKTKDARLVVNNINEIIEGLEQMKKILKHNKYIED